jgi:branched-subunit amino acid ABC-type transport system permease component
MTQPKEFWKKVSILALGGGAAFWLTNFAISLTPIAADYRAALSIPYFPMLLQALVGGLIIGFCVSYFLLRFFEKIPPTNPMLKSLLLSFIALIAATVLIEAPSKFLTTTGEAAHYFLVAGLFNVLRILALGITVGYLYQRQSKASGQSAMVSESAKPS